MSKKQYIALQAIQYVDENGTRRSIEPRSDKHSGLFEHEFDKKTEKRLFGIGALREPEGTEEHEDETQVDSLHDSRDIDGVVSAVDPLDHDKNGKKGGAAPAETAAAKKARVAAEKAAAAEAAADAEAAAAAQKDAAEKAAAEAATGNDETKPSDELLG